MSTGEPKAGYLRIAVVLERRQGPTDQCSLTSHPSLVACQLGANALHIFVWLVAGRRHVLLIFVLTFIALQDRGNLERSSGLILGHQPIQCTFLVL